MAKVSLLGPTKIGVLLATHPSVPIMQQPTIYVISPKVDGTRFLCNAHPSCMDPSARYICCGNPSYFDAESDTYTWSSQFWKH
jgi:hypothetical protein